MQPIINMMVTIILSPPTTEALLGKVRAPEFQLNTMHHMLLRKSKKNSCSGVWLIQLNEAVFCDNYAKVHLQQYEI